MQNWRHVRRRFELFLESLRFTPQQATYGESNRRGVIASLNRAFWNMQDESANSVVIGFWGKGTQVRPPRDIDILFVLPIEIYW